MGLCLGQCFTGENTNFTSISDGQEEIIVDCDEQNHTKANTTIFEIFKLKTKRRSQFLSHFWHHHHQNQHQTQNASSYSRLNASRTNSALTIDNQNYVKSQLQYDAIQLQCLDVGSLLKMNERHDYKRLHDSTTEGTPSFAGSSLDLQWEHEYDNDQPYPPYSWHNSQDDLSSSESEENGCSIEMSQITSSSNAKLNQQNNNNNYQPVMTSNRKTNRNRLRNRNHCSTASRAESETKIKSINSWSHISTPESLEWDVHDDDDDPKFKSDDDLIDRETVELLNEIEWLKNRALVETGDTEWKTEQTNS